MTFFFTSDTHFDHANIIKYCNRPFASAEEMTEALIKNWNNVVSPNDTIYHLGDFAFSKSPARTKEILSRLNGKKHLVYGNHDKQIKKDHDLKSCFESIHDLLEVRDGDGRFTLCHYSMRVWNKSHHKAIHLFGHSHGSLAPFGRSVDVGVDSPFITGKIEYRPFSASEIYTFMKGRDVSVVDHHVSKDL